MNKQFNQRTGSRGIEWCDFTWNTIGGCLHQCAWTMLEGSTAACYAKGIAEGVARASYTEGFEKHYFRADKLGQPLNENSPSIIFPDSMSDLAGHWVPEKQIHQVLAIIAQAHWHQFAMLTKNAPRLLQLKSVLPPNFWAGVSSPPDFMWGQPLSRRQQEKMVHRQLRVLEKLSLPVLWMSIEPLSWDIAPLLRDCPLGWVVIGAATNGRKTYQPDPRQVESLLQTLDDQNIPVFFKGNLDWSPWREDFPALRVPALVRRQEQAQKYDWAQNRFLPIETAATRHGLLERGDSAHEQ